jgi:membrane-associated phospholipid phosphatase
MIIGAAGSETSDRAAPAAPSRRRVQPRLLVALVVAAVALATGTVMTMTGSATNTSAKDRIVADPPPPLFAEAAIDPTGKSVDATRSEARHLFAAWVADHGTSPDDKAFVSWIEQTFPKPPADLARQLTTVAALAPERTGAGVAAATWLEAHGKKDVWKLYAHDQRERVAGARGKDIKKEEKVALKLAKTVADALGTRFGSSAPYVRQPSLRPDHHVTAGQHCPCSYPSRHAAAAAASETLLGHLQPTMDAEYRHMEAEIDYSRIYMAGHFPADISAGAVLGDVIGDYLLVTREHVDPAQL